MKQILFFASLFFLASCSSLDPDACTCGKELKKQIADQDQDMMNACAQKGEAMSDKEKVRWFEDVMNCVE
jgi:hypothetical protein